MLDEGVHVAQRRRQGEDLDVVHHGADRVHAALDVGAHHAAETVVHLLLGDGVGGMALQTGIVHAVDLRMVLQELCDLHGIGTGDVHAGGQRLHALHHEPGFERSKNSAEALHKGHTAAVDQLFAACDDTGGRCAVTAQIFRRAVNDHIRAQVDGVLQIGRSEGAVDDQLHAFMLVNDLGDRFDVGDLQGRVGRGLHIDQRRIGLDGVCNILGIRGVDSGVGDPKIGQDLSKQRKRASVDDVAEDHVVAGLQAGQSCRGDGTEAGSQRQRRFCVLQMGYFSLQFVAGRTAETAVDEALVHMLIEVDSAVKVVQDKGRGLIDRAGMGGCDALIIAPQLLMDLIVVKKIGLETHSFTPFRIWMEMFEQVFALILYRNKRGPARNKV